MIPLDSILPSIASLIRELKPSYENRPKNL